MNYLEEYKVDVPEGRVGPWAIERFTVPKEPNIEMMRLALAGRPVPPGEYTRLTHDRRGVIMSDTPAEIRDHSGFFGRLRARFSDVKPRRVLIHGLGMGMALRYALLQDHVEHVDVVEIDADVIALVGPHYADDRLTIHHGDALDFRFPPGTTWDLAWHDIWDEISADNLAQIARLKRRYGRRVDWQAAWCEWQMRDRR